MYPSVFYVYNLFYFAKWILSNPQIFHFCFSLYVLRKTLDYLYHVIWHILSTLSIIFWIFSSFLFIKNDTIFLILFYIFVHYFAKIFTNISRSYSCSINDLPFDSLCSTAIYSGEQVFLCSSIANVISQWIESTCLLLTSVVRNLGHNGNWKVKIAKDTF